ncbi:hypothetical protein MB02_12600 [Croceicoccus estronivorus]|uniref:hypothetical protein n=1 Tax=Croceicoccus estronivorus TaxID=1172626 RepID=UPI00082B0B19|nr:hypothetical protein [Croceicoccus estronivorus]OCC23441.1 hypothetical protein MB02_12600 [Croceicoccus estronivorus]
MLNDVTIPPRRAFTQPQAGDNWETLAKRLFPEEPLQEAVQKLQSWNLFLAFRPGGGGMTPSDIVFTEAPRAA